MTAAGLFSIYESIDAPAGDGSISPLFAVKPIVGHQNYFVGKDISGQACLLVATTDRSGHKPPPIRLESLDAQFELECQIRDAAGNTRNGSFTAVRCRSLETETVRYFFSVCRIIIRHLGDLPSRGAVSAAVRRIASILQNIKKPPVRSLNGLFGELFVISRSRSPVRTVAAWRIDDTSRFDFTVGDVRMDVKSCAGRIRVHTFSYDQCNPPPSTHAVVASIFVERIPGGVSLAELVTDIEAQISGDENLVLKLHDIVASTLGTSLAESLDVSFDPRLAESSLQFFDLHEIPALRCPLPSGVSNVSFTSDLSMRMPITSTELIDRDPQFWHLLPAFLG